MRWLWIGSATLGLVGSAGAWEQHIGASGEPSSWVGRTIVLHLNEDAGQALPLAEVEARLRASMATWNAVACSDLRLEYAGTTPMDWVGFRPDETNQNIVRWVDSGWPYAPNRVAAAKTWICAAPGGACAYTGQIVDADIEINGEHFQFTDPDAPGYADLANALTHELGHVFGLGHSALPEATMYGLTNPGETLKQTLEPDDVEGLCAMYPEGTHGTEQASASADCTARPGGRASPMGWLLLGLAGLWLGRRTSLFKKSTPGAARRTGEDVPT